MAILMDILLFLHLLGMAMIIGLFLATIKNPKVLPGMLHASFLQLITGLAMFGIREAQGSDDMSLRIKFSVKLILAIVVTVFALLGNRKQKAFAGAPGDSPQPSATYGWVAFVTAIVTVGVAVFWN